MSQGRLLDLLTTSLIRRTWLTIAPDSKSSSLRARLPLRLFKSSPDSSQHNRGTHAQEDAQEEKPPMSSTREPKPVGGQMSEGVGVSRKKSQPSRLVRVREYVLADAKKAADGDIWGGRGARGYG